MRPVLLALLAAAAGPAAAQHHGGSHAAPGVAEAFTVDGLRVDEAAPPAGSAVGRAGLRFDDGGYVSVVYGKPYARGRAIYGGLVGYGQVWVAGAHRATELATTVPLRIGGARVEPGVYALFVTPRPHGWTLHVNRVPGQHIADEYDAAADVATVAVAPTVLDVPAEALAWSFADDGRSLRLAWGPLAATFPIARADR